MRQRLLVVMGVAAMMPLVSVTATVWVQLHRARAEFLKRLEAMPEEES